MAERLVIPDTEAARRAFGDILSEAFGTPRASVEPWVERSGVENTRVWWVGDEVVGGLMRVPMGLFVEGRSVSNLGLAGVGVRVDRLRHGHATAMMRAAVREASADGFAVASLYAASPALYRKVGFEPSGELARATVRRADLPRFGADLPVHRAGADDHATLEAIYTAWARPRTGALDRGPYCWARVREGSVFQAPPATLLVGPREAPEGYVVYRRSDPASDGSSQLRVLDLAATTPRALRRLVDLLGDLSTLAREIRVPTHPADPLWALVPHTGWTTTVEEPLYLRVLDVVGALQGRGWAPGRAGEVVFALDDDLLPEQAGVWRLAVEGGEARLTRGGSPTVRLTARGLATILTGYRTPADAAWLGLAEGDAADLDRLGSLLAGPTPWMRDFF